MAIEWWHWAVAGMVLILAELAVPAFVLIWFGLGALLVALVVAVFSSLGITAQLAIWLLLSLALVGLWFVLFKPGLYRSRVGMSASGLLGEVGLLTHEVSPFEKGEVRFQKPMLGAEVWPCIADESIDVGSRVRVLTVEGSLLKVGRN